MPASLIYILQIKIYNFTHFPTGTTNRVKNSMACVVVMVCHGGNPHLIINFVGYIQRSTEPPFPFQRITIFQQKRQSISSLAFFPITLMTDQNNLKISFYNKN